MIVIIGKTCSGKDTILNKLVSEYGYKKIVTYTTRKPRINETPDVDYHYITNEYFDSLNEEGFFAETTSYTVANGETWKYGTARKDLKDDRIIILNPYGLKKLREDKTLNITAVRLFASHGETWNRLRSRGDSSDEAARRIEADKKDFEDIDEYVDLTIRTDSFWEIDKIAYLIDKFYSLRKE
jgi:guanylate kinase